MIGNPEKREDALISTDVDMLIHTISKKRKTDLYELEKETGIERKTINEWLNFLEEEGYVKIDYRLTDTFITWLGQSDRPTVHTGETKRKYETEKKVLDAFSDVKYDRIKMFEKGIQTAKKATEKKRDKKRKATVKKPAPQKEKSIKNQHKKPKKQLIKQKKAIIKQVRALPIAGSEDDDRPAREGTNVRDTVSKYMDAITRQKAEIEKLRQQKEKLYRENYLELESKVETNISDMTERLLEKHTKILELKEQILELPEKVAEADKLQESIRKINRDGMISFKETKQRIDALLDSIRESEESLEKKIGSSKGSIVQSMEKLKDLEVAAGSLEERIGEINSTLEKTKDVLDDVNERMSSTLTDLEETTELKNEISELGNAVREDISEKKGELDDLEKQFGEIKKVEKWIREYMRDYDEKTEEIENYINESSDDLRELQAATETKQIRIYLAELEKLADDYEQEIEGTMDKEKAIDERIENSKAKLRDLIAKSKDALRELHARTSLSQPSDVKDRIDSRKDKFESLLSEKENERDKLIEDIKRARDEK